MSTPKPTWRVTLDGKDLTDAIRPRLIELSVSSSREDTADQLDIRLDDSDGGMDLPPRTATLRVWLGWSDTGLVDMGSFVVDEVEHAGAPDTITLRARSANLRSDLRAQREQSYHDTTCGAIVDQLAGRHGLTPRCASALASQAIEHIDQTNESDVNFLNRLGKRFDAVATVKAGALLFAPIGAATTASGKPLPAITLTRASGDQHRFLVADRDAFTGVKAKYQDAGSAQTGEVIAGEDKGNGTKVLRHTYASKQSALRGARSELQRLQRAAATFSLALARGRPDIYPEQHVTVRGFKRQIDGTDWIVVKAEHRLGDNGLTTSLELECKPEGVDNAPEGGVSG